ncbi:MAG: amidohydrolase family protein [Sphingomonadaceae bacterium]|nr:amidohydrolase family protein [Sphingomonadaceae bacterium]
MDAQYDLVIRNGSILDGSGKDAFMGGVAIAEGRIVAVGVVEGRGRAEIDAAGLTVTPGFIDIHTHYDGHVTWEERSVPSGEHGVTTVVTGNCGVGFAPVRAPDRERLVSLMAGVEDIPEVADGASCGSAAAFRRPAERARMVAAQSAARSAGRLCGSGGRAGISSDQAHSISAGAGTNMMHAPAPTQIVRRLVAAMAHAGPV